MAEPARSFDSGAPSHSILATASLALAGSLWGTGFLFGKMAMLEMDVLLNVVLRFCFACLFLLPIFLRHTLHFKRKDLWTMLAASVIGIPIQFLVQFKGLQLTTISHASLMVGTLPVLLALASTIFLRERLTFIEWGVLFLSGLGAFLITVSKGNGDAPQATVKGDLLVLLSMVAAVVFVLLSKNLLATYDPLKITVSMIYSGTVLLMICALVAERSRFSFSPRAWIGVAAQGLLATALAYIFWNWGIARVPAARAGVFLNMEPLVGTLLGVFVWHETLGSTALLGGAIIIAAAVYFSVRMHTHTT